MTDTRLPGLGSAIGAAAGPIEAELHGLMNALASGLDDIFNGADCRPEDRKTWFFLAAGAFTAPGVAETSRFNYISNADKADVRVVLKDVLARLEARMHEGGRA